MALTSETLKNLLEISYLVGSVMELDDILQEVCDHAARLMRSKVSSIYLLDESRERLVLGATHGLNRALVGKASMPVSQGLPGWVVRNNEMAVVSDVREDPRYRPIKGSGEEPFVAYLCSPLRIQEEVIGVMTVRREQPEKWSEDDTTLFEMISVQVGIVIEKSRMHFDRLEKERLAAIGLSLSEIAHYIKNLLQGMNGGQYFLESGLKRSDLDRAQRGWEMLDRNQKKIATLVENMLNYSRSSSLQFEMENLNGLIYDLARSVEETAQRRGITFKVLLDDTIPELPMAYDPLHEAILNLITNAMDAIPEGRGGEVVITSRLDLVAEVARISVSDTGVGIPDDQKDRIFRLFYSTKGRRGTGIGLAVTRKIIEEHGGRVTFESEAGKGTTFHIELPLERKHAAIPGG